MILGEKDRSCKRMQAGSGTILFVPYVNRQPQENSFYVVGKSMIIIWVRYTHNLQFILKKQLVKIDSTKGRPLCAMQPICRIALAHGNENVRFLDPAQ